MKLFKATFGNQLLIGERGNGNIVGVCIYDGHKTDLTCVHSNFFEGRSFKEIDSVKLKSKKVESNIVLYKHKDEEGILILNVSMKNAVYIKKERLIPINNLADLMYISGNDIPNLSEFKVVEELILRSI
ncbi:MAG: hypothetical protein SLAVMIC_00834 [uncultured marine phage]|uniref:Uncharacterized protein n=1 Tax=uncultured marine phage TaxID=707152 RepID=A0A8D9CC87_9VIRU|nr:MAG: hypothetical protein SLAVMIC_00834 [uncultured marine phage]